MGLSDSTLLTHIHIIIKGSLLFFSPLNSESKAYDGGYRSVDRTPRERAHGRRDQIRNRTQLQPHGASILQDPGVRRDEGRLT